MSKKCLSTVRVYIHQRPGEEQYALVCDMSEYSYCYGALVGTKDIEVEWEAFDVNPAALLVEKIEQEICSVVLEYDGRLRELRDRAAQLRCIEYRPGES